MKKIIYKMLSVLLAVLVVAGGITLPSGRDAQASVEFDTTNAVSFSAFAKRHEIPQGTILIGTHLIYMGTATDELWEQALDTQTVSNQMNEYYKSELADGEWFDITDAASIDDITAEGTITDEDSLADLYIEYYTFEDGITKSAKTDESICAFDNPDPYDLYNLEELQSIRTQYDQIDSKEDLTDSDDHNVYWTLHLLWQADVQNDKTKKCDKELKALQKLYEKLMKSENEEEAAIVYKLMGKVDATRRAEVFRQLCDMDDNYLEQLEKKYEGESFDGDDFVENSELMDGYGDSLEACQESYTTYSGNGLDEGSTILKQLEYKYSKRIIDNADSGLTSSMKTNLQKLQYIFNIEDDVVEDASGEASLLDKELVPKAASAYTSAVEKSPSSAYKNAVKKKKSKAIQEKLLSEQQDEMNQERLSLQYLISAKIKRLGSQDALTYIYKRIEWADKLYKQVPDTDLKDYADATIQQHIIWLTDEAKKIKDESDTATSELDKLKDKKSELQEKQDEALDDNDLKSAKEYGAQIEAVDDQITNATNDLTDTLNNGDAAEQAEAGVDLGSDTLEGYQNNIMNSALDDILDGNGDDIGNDVDCLAATGAYDQLNSILSALKKNGGSMKMKRTVRQAKKTAKESALYDDGEDSSDDSGISQDDLLSAISDFFGASFDDLGDGQQIIVIMALNKLGDDGVAAARSLAMSLVSRAANADNKYVYERLTDSTESVYVELKALAAVAKYRYVYSDTKKVATLTKGGSILKYKVGSQTMTNTKKKVKLEGKVLMQTEPYASEDAAENIKCVGQIITNSNYGVVATNGMSKKADSLYDEFKGGE